MSETKLVERVAGAIQEGEYAAKMRMRLVNDVVRDSQSRPATGGAGALCQRNREVAWDIYYANAPEMEPIRSALTSDSR